MSDDNKELKEYQNLNKLEQLKLKIKIGREANERLRQLNIKMQKTLEKLKNTTAIRDNRDENL